MSLQRRLRQTHRNPEVPASVRAEAVAPEADWCRIVAELKLYVDDRNEFTRRYKADELDPITRQIALDLMWAFLGGPPRPEALARVRELLMHATNDAICKKAGEVLRALANDDPTPEIREQAISLYEKTFPDREWRYKPAPEIALPSTQPAPPPT